jgi:hypothetical protein
MANLLSYYTIKLVTAVKSVTVFRAVMNTAMTGFVTIIPFHPNPTFVATEANSLPYYTIVLVFIPDNPFKPSLMFAGEARSYLSEAPFRCSTLG